MIQISKESTEYFKNYSNISFDVAVMEKTQNGIISP